MLVFYCRAVDVTNTFILRYLCWLRNYLQWIDISDMLKYNLLIPLRQSVFWATKTKVVGNQILFSLMRSCLEGTCISARKIGLTFIASLKVWLRWTKMYTKFYLTQNVNLPISKNLQSNQLFESCMLNSSKF